MSPALSDPITSRTPTVSSDTSTDTYKTTQSDFANAEDHRLRGRRFYLLSNRSSGFIARALSSQEELVSRGRQSISQTIKAIFGRQSRVPSASTTATGISLATKSAGESNITLPVRCSGTARDIESGEKIKELDLGPLRRVRREQERKDIRKGDKDWGFEWGPRLHFSGGRVRSDSEGGQPSSGSGLTVASGNVQQGEESESGNSVYSGVSEGSEVEVDGGVALTEEAVETHAPDIVMVKVVAPAGGGEDTLDDDSQGVELMNIMTQV